MVKKNNRFNVIFLVMSLIIVFFTMLKVHINIK
ncbi:putative membrane protein [Clostridium sporogenes]|uniref:Putative membrane protein n=1 Tax=Clostridium sporogenes TaxID=1509 RepID=A0A1L3NHC1_CLOSG|nr:putative membrane protein [Clostridium sporogenes]